MTGMAGPGDGLRKERIAELLDRAVRIASRGHGGAEPNPMVGCVIASSSGEVLGEGFHRKCGGPHAEIDALRSVGTKAHGSVAIVTLEPCAHRGRTGPCADALIDAGVSRVYYAVGDPNPLARGGASRLIEAGIPAERIEHAGAKELARPFIKRVTTGLPWVMAKWAQSIDGAIALGNGDSRWISCGRSRRMVHRERGRVDAILTGIGTVIADDPRLTARDVRIQRRARRIVFDPMAETPVDAAVMDRQAETTLLVRAELSGPAFERSARLRAAGARIIELGPDGTLRDPLATLAREGVATLMVEAGGGLVGRMARERLLDEAWVFIGPLLVGSDDAVRAMRGFDRGAIREIDRARLVSMRRRGADALLQYRF